MTDREKALMRVQTSAFAVTEATLFLDTHPGSREALDYYHKAVNEYNDAVNIFITNFGPLEATQVKSRDNWTWTEGCMPWEGECNVEL
ncbi:MAG: spore coat protein CotJB [Clostridia bacterium]|nr:spore coat protein CotJB [Clostridia bacterium]